jgi:hypothetical protein
MNKKILTLALCTGALLTSAPSASAFSLKDLLGSVGSSLGNTSSLTDAASSLLDGVFTKTSISLSDIAGTWKSSGSAVNFTSDNALLKAGGTATAGVIEGKLDPYYQKYGLDSAIITITTDGTITMQVGSRTLSGTIEPTTDSSKYNGNFLVKFKALGVLSLGTMDTYVTYTNNILSSGKSLKIMFDAKKLQTLMKGIAAFSKSSLASGASSLLSQYDGMCVGFKLSAYSSTSK